MLSNQAAPFHYNEIKPGRTCNFLCRYPITAVHEIKPGSPIAGWTSAQAKRQDVNAEIIVTIKVRAGRGWGRLPKGLTAQDVPHARTKSIGPCSFVRIVLYVEAWLQPKMDSTPTNSIGLCSFHRATVYVEESV